MNAHDIVIIAVSVGTEIVTIVFAIRHSITKNKELIQRLEQKTSRDEIVIALNTTIASIDRRLSRIEGQMTARAYATRTSDDAKF